MSRLDERIDRPFVVEIAALVESAHAPKSDGDGSTRPGRCIDCTPDGCKSVEWAAPILAEHRQRRTMACAAPVPWPQSANSGGGHR